MNFMESADATALSLVADHGADNALQLAFLIFGATLFHARGRAAFEQLQDHLEAILGDRGAMH